MGEGNSHENELISSKTNLKDMIWLQIPTYNNRTIPSKSVQVGKSTLE